MNQLDKIAERIENLRRELVRGQEAHTIELRTVKNEARENHERYEERTDITGKKIVCLRADLMRGQDEIRCRIKNFEDGQESLRLNLGGIRNKINKNQSYVASKMQIFEGKLVDLARLTKESDCEHKFHWMQGYTCTDSKDIAWSCSKCGMITEFRPNNEACAAIKLLGYEPPGDSEKDSPLTAEEFKRRLDAGYKAAKKGSP